MGSPSLVSSISSCSASSGIDSFIPLIHQQLFCTSSVCHLCHGNEPTPPELEKGLQLAGLRANPAKSASLRIVVDGKRKYAVSGIEPFSRMNGELVGILDPSRSYKNLGLNFSLVDKEPNAFRKFRDGCEELTKAPLKPQQRIYFLRIHLLPALYHELVLGGRKLPSPC